MCWSALVIAVVGGTLTEKLHMEPYVEEFIRIRWRTVDHCNPQH